MGGAARERVSRKKTPRPSPGDPPPGGVTEGWAFSPRSDGWELRTRRPRSWSLTRETNALMPGFGERKGNCKTAGNRKSAPKRHACGLTQPKNHHESARSKGVWSMSEGNPLTHLESSPRGRKQPGCSPGTEPPLEPFLPFQAASLALVPRGPI